MLLRRQSERLADDWFSLIALDFDGVPALDLTGLTVASPSGAAPVGNNQDMATWEREAAVIAASERKIDWHQPRRHEGTEAPSEAGQEIFAGIESFVKSMPASAGEIAIQGGRERGLLLHKLMEEILSGETPDEQPALISRAKVLLGQLGLEDHDDVATGPSSAELASTVRRMLALPDIVALRPRLEPEFWIYAGVDSDNVITLTAGIVDAVAFDASGCLDIVIDWKSDIDPGAAVVEQYRTQIRDYLSATSVATGMIVFMTCGRIEHVSDT